MLIHRIHRMASLLLISIVLPMQVATAQPMVIEYQSGLSVEIKNRSHMCTAVATMGTNVLTSAEYRSQTSGITRGCHLPILELFTTTALEVSQQ